MELVSGLHINSFRINAFIIMVILFWYRCSDNASGVNALPHTGEAPPRLPQVLMGSDLLEYGQCGD
jgi:hypothetical protein